MIDRPIRVLLVEDNPHDAILVQELFGDTNVPTDITTVSDGEQAIQAMRGALNHSPVPDLVLLDLNLPKKNGHEVLEFIRSNERTAHLCVLIYTGSSSPDDQRRARRNNANGYLVKPMGMKEMDETIRKLRDALTTISKGSCPTLADGR